MPFSLFVAYAHSVVILQFRVGQRYVNYRKALEETGEGEGVDVGGGELKYTILS